MNALIEELKADLRPVRPPPPLTRSVAGWLSLSWLFVLATTLATGSLRPDVVAQLQTSPRFLLECLIGLSVPVLAAWGGIALAIPGYQPAARSIVPGLLLAASWLGLFLYGLSNPSLVPSMIGKREFCFYQTLVFSLPPLAALFFALRRSVALRPAWTGLLGGVASASMPALMMQVACMYDPWHIITHHLEPIGLMAALGAFLGWRFLPRP